MRIDILTLFPEMFECVLSASMLGRAQANGLIDIRVHNIRDYTDNKHRKADDYPFGGGAGLVMMAQPIYDCMDAVLEGKALNEERNKGEQDTRAPSVDPNAGMGAVEREMA